MNLAVRDIRHHLGRFAFTSVGISLLLMIVMGMGGIYRGLIQEATLLVDRIGADLWVVQGGTRGPFAEVSRLAGNLENRVRAVWGRDCAPLRLPHHPAGASGGALAHGGPGSLLAGGAGGMAPVDRRPTVADGSLRDDRGPFAWAAYRGTCETRQGRLSSGRFDARVGRLWRRGRTSRSIRPSSRRSCWWRVRWTRHGASWGCSASC